jgi:hypothetical protein
MKTKWSKETPTVEGWYWIKYKNKRNYVSVCPCEVVLLQETTMVHTALHDSFYEGPNHGGPGLKYQGKVDKSIRFGPSIVTKSRNFQFFSKRRP